MVAEAQIVTHAVVVVGGHVVLTSFNLDSSLGKGPYTAARGGPAHAVMV